MEGYQERYPTKFQVLTCGNDPTQKQSILWDTRPVLPTQACRYRICNTTPTSNHKSMAQFGSALKRIIATVADGQRKDKKILFSKLDIKNGFWRMVVNAADAWNFCYVISNADADASIEETQILIPNSLQIGWYESPSFFCTASETARDVIQSLLHITLPPHILKAKMLPTDFGNLPLHDLATTMTLLEVFIDDFIACTDNISQQHILQLSRAMLHGIHTVFPPTNSITKHNGGDPISETKLDKLEGL